MGWYVDRGGGSVGPVDGTIVVQWIQQGMRDGSVCDESTGVWVPIAQSPFAQFVVPPAPLSIARQASGEGLGYVILLLPLAATALIWFWIGEMNLLQDPSGNLALLGMGTVVLTAILIAVEAGSLGMGKSPAENGRMGSSPVSWFFGTLLVWIVVFPIYLGKRKWYGRRSLAIGGVIVALVFGGSWLSMTWSIESAKASLRASLSRLNE
jgi:hypothetical protein